MLKIQHVLLLLLLLTGCAVRQPVPATWRLAGRTLMPPGVSTDVARQTFTAPIRARCAISDSDAISIQQRRSHMKVTVKRDALLKQPRGWLTTWTLKAESEGCIAPGQAVVLASRIVESLALPSGADLRLLRVDGSPDYVEIGAATGLQVVSPILRPGASPQALEYEIGKITESPGGLVVDLATSPPDLIGFETAWYELRPKAAGDGFTIVSVSAKATVNGMTESLAAPAKNYFQFAPEMGHFRLFYKADQTEVLLAARTRASLPAGTEVCDRPVSGGPVCLAIPKGVAVNPYLMVEVNGNKIGVGIGSNLRSLLGSMKMSGDKAPPTLEITRLWGGKRIALKFDRSLPDILNLVLTGNEQIRW